MDAPLRQVGNYVDDAAVLLVQHETPHRLAQQECRAYVAGVQFIPLLDGDFLGGFGEEAAGIVDQNVRALVGRCEGPHHAGCSVRRVPGAANAVHRLAGNGGDGIPDGVQAALMARHGEYAGAGFGEGGGQVARFSSAGAGYDGGVAGEVVFCG